MINPAGISASPAHIIRSFDNGDSWLLYQNDFGNDVVSNLHENSADSNVLYTRNMSDTNTGVFYVNKTIAGTLPFKVAHGGLYIAATGPPYAVAGASGTQNQRVQFSLNPYTTWYDVTRNYPNSASSNPGAITGVVIV
jgi:hypothetical protein